MMENRKKRFVTVSEKGERAMLFPDVTCVVSDSLKRWMDDGVCELIEADHIAVVTIFRETKEIQIQGAIHLNPVDEIVIGEFLESKREEFLGDLILSNYCYKNHYFHMTSNKRAKPFIAFVLVCRFGTPFQDKDLRWLDIYCALSYKKTIINNEAIQEKNFLKSIWDDSSRAIVALTTGGRILRPNPTAVRMFSLDQNDTLQIPDPVQQERLEDAIRSALRNNERRYLDKVILDTDAGERVLDILVAPLEDSKSKIAGVVVVATDTTESRLLSMEVEQLRQYGLLGEVSSGLAHDIKNPLMSIRGSAKLLVRKEEQTELQQNLVNIIVHEADRIDEVINQMMAYGDISHRVEESYVDINGVLTKCARIIERQKFSKHINILLTLDKAMPPLWARELHLQQVFLNLLLNSLQAIPSKGNISIISMYEAKKRLGTVVIEDTGTGFTPEIREKIFNPYFTTKEKGTGMGLFIVKRTLSKYNADISLDSTEGSGTRCTIHFQL